MVVGNLQVAVVDEPLVVLRHTAGTTERTGRVDAHLVTAVPISPHFHALYYIKIPPCPIPPYCTTDPAAKAPRKSAVDKRIELNHHIIMSEFESIAESYRN